MEVVLGFVIAVTIALTGVGAGALTTPLLIFLLGLPGKEVVGTALLFGAIVKVTALPMYWARRKVNYRTLGYLLVGGLPGVLAGSLIMRRLDGQWVLAIVGFTVMLVALVDLFQFRRPVAHDLPR